MQLNRKTIEIEFELSEDTVDYNEYSTSGTATLELDEDSAEKLYEILKRALGKTDTIKLPDIIKEAPAAPLPYIPPYSPQIPWDQPITVTYSTQTKDTK
jgi:hypothetical protein